MLAALSKEKEEGPRCLTLEDEYGLADVIVPPTARPEDEGLPGVVLLVEGTVEEQHGSPLVKASKVERPLPAGAAEAALPLRPHDAAKAS